MSQPAWLQSDVEGAAQTRDDVAPLKPSSSTEEADDEVEISFQLDPNNLSCMKISEMPRKRGIYWMFKFLTISLCLLMVLTALIGLTDVTGIEETGRIFVAVYMIFFAGLLMLFEISQIRPCKIKCIFNLH